MASGLSEYVIVYFSYLEQLNSNIEFRNSKQYRITKIPMTQTKP